MSMSLTSLLREPTLMTFRPSPMLSSELLMLCCCYCYREWGFLIWNNRATVKTSWVLLTIVFSLWSEVNSTLWRNFAGQLWFAIEHSLDFTSFSFKTRQTNQSAQSHEVSRRLVSSATSGKRMSNSSNSWAPACQIGSHDLFSIRRKLSLKFSELIQE